MQLCLYVLLTTVGLHTLNSLCTVACFGQAFSTVGIQYSTRQYWLCARYSYDVFTIQITVSVQAVAWAVGREVVVGSRLAHKVCCGFATHL